MPRPKIQNEWTKREKIKAAKKVAYYAAKACFRPDNSRYEVRVIHEAMPAFAKMVYLNYELAMNMDEVKIVSSFRQYIDILERRKISPKHYIHRSMYAKSRSFFPCCSEYPGFPFCNSKC